MALWRRRAPSHGSDATALEIPARDSRAFKFDLPDAIDPVVHVPEEPAVHVQDEVAVVPHTCTDRGGSSLQSCDSSAPGGVLDTSTLGEHTVDVIATDGEGNTDPSPATLTAEIGPRGQG